MNGGIYRRGATEGARKNRGRDKSKGKRRKIPSTIKVQQDSKGGGEHSMQGRKLKRGRVTDWSKKKGSSSKRGCVGGGRSFRRG